MSSKEKRKSAFKVTDKRSFTADGQLRQDQEESKESRPAENLQTDQSGQPGSEQVEAPGQEPRAMDFASFVLSLATTAMVHLGEVADPASGSRTTNLDAAKQMIDILAMLQEKTEGNRTPEETRLLDEILYELRMKALRKPNRIQL